MPGKIQMKRGTYAAMDLNALYQGEWYYCTDTKQIYMAHGDGTGVLIGSGADAAEILAALGVTASATELNYVDGVTAAIQTQLDGKTPVDGWIAAGETWTYASANTVTVAGDVSGKYQKGDKIKLTQTTAKFFYVLSAVYSAPNTTITVTGGADYTIANAAITLPYYSREAYPFGFPGWFSWAPTFTGFSSPPSIVARFRLDGSCCFIRAKTTGAGTSNATNFKLSLPIAPNATVGLGVTSPGLAANNGVETIASFSVYGYLDSDLVVRNGFPGTTWEDSGSKYADVPPMFYEIA